MGRGTLLVITAGILAAASVAVIGQRSQFEMKKQEYRYERTVIAREVALSGIERGLSAIKLELMDVRRSFGDRPVSGGTYDVAISENHYGDLNLSSRGTVGAMRHEIQSNVIFESPIEAALVLAGTGLRVDSAGTYMINGVDSRMPTVATGSGFLRSIKGVRTDSPANRAEIESAIRPESMQGEGGDGSISHSVDVSAFETVYQESISRPDKIAPLPPYVGSFGSADNPAIVHIVGNFAPAGTFQGTGILVVENGDFVVSDGFQWEGLVLVRKNPVSEIDVRFDGSATVYGGMAVFEAPGLPSGVCEDVPFDIDNLETVPQVPFQLRTEVLGAAISYGGDYGMPVTSRIHTGDNTTDPWGSYTEALSGNVNRDGVFVYEPSNPLPAGTGVTVSGTSWKRISGDGTANADWESYMEQNSDDPSSSQLKVLRDGDPVPDISGYLDQGSVADFVANYIDPVTNRISLDRNQSIYLFELGTTNSSSAAYDFQDLVVLVSMLRSDAGCSFAASSGSSIDFSMVGGQVRYSGEAIAKIGKKLPSIEQTTRVVIASQRDRLLTPEESSIVQTGG